MQNVKPCRQSRIKLHSSGITAEQQKIVGLTMSFLSFLLPSAPARPGPPQRHLKKRSLLLMVLFSRAVCSSASNRKQNQINARYALKPSDGGRRQYILQTFFPCFHTKNYSLFLNKRYANNKKRTAAIFFNNRFYCI